MAERYQVVWDWRLVLSLPRIVQPTGGLAHIYRWILLFGPLQIRRWEDRPAPHQEGES